MKSRFATLLLLAVAAVVLIWLARDAGETPAPVTRAGLLIPDLDTRAVTSLELKLVYGAWLELEREPAGPWFISSPSREAARNDLVELLLENVARARVEPIELDGVVVEAEAVGLEPPRHVITLGGEGWSETLLLGDVESLGRAVYARRAGTSEIVIVTRNVVSQLQYSAQDFVDPRLFRGLVGNYDLVRLEDDEVELAAEREAGEWVLTAPAPYVADSAALSSLARRLGQLEQSSMAVPIPSPADFARLGLPTEVEAARDELGGATRLVLGTVGQQPRAVYLGAGWRTTLAEEVPCVRDDFAKIVRVDRRELLALARPVDTYRSRRVMPPTRERAQRLRIEHAGDVVLEIERDDIGGAWTFGAPEVLRGETVEARLVHATSPLSRLLARVDGLAATDFGPVPEGEPLGRVRVEWTRAGERRVDGVTLFEPDEQGVPAVASSRPDEGLRLAPEVLELLDPFVARRLRSLDPVEVDEDRWARVEIDVPGAGSPFTIERDPESGRWVGDDEWGRRYGLAWDLLHRFRALRWEPRRDAAGFDRAVRWLDADGRVLAELAFRVRTDDEPREVDGLPIAVARWSGVEDAELLVSADWLQRFDDLLDEPERN